MVNKPDVRKIGIFVATGFVCFALILGTYLKKVFFPDDSNTVVMYFQESIKGLNVGSSVIFQGVEIGKVSQIDLVANLKDLTFSIPVYVELDVSKSIVSGDDERSRKQILDALIQKGLRARLTAQNYLTGQLMIELVMLPDTEIKLEPLPQDKDLLQIPTILSPLQELSRGLQNIPFQKIADTLGQMADSLNKQLPVVLPQISEAATSISKVFSTNARLSTEALGNFNRALVNVSAAAQSLKDLTDYLERHPEALLRGKEK